MASPTHEILHGGGVAYWVEFSCIAWISWRTGVSSVEGGLLERKNRVYFLKWIPAMDYSLFHGCRFEDHLRWFCIQRRMTATWTVFLDHNSSAKNKIKILTLKSGSFAILVCRCVLFTSNSFRGLRGNSHVTTEIMKLGESNMKLQEGSQIYWEAVLLAKCSDALVGISCSTTVRVGT